MDFIKVNDVHIGYFSAIQRVLPKSCVNTKHRYHLKAIGLELNTI